MRFLASMPACATTEHERSSACSYRVAWSINPHMVVGSVDPVRAVTQHAELLCVVRALGGHVHTLPFVHGAFDSVFAKDNALYARRARVTRGILGMPRHPERKIEQTIRRDDLIRAGIAVEPSTPPFEGGDVVVMPGRRAFLGHGFRSSRDAIAAIESFLGLPVTPLELIDAALYHLDTALAVVADGVALACEDAFAPASWQALQRACKVIPVSRSEALRFALNVVRVGRAIVTGTESPEVARACAELGLRTVYTPLDEFHRAGGSAACLLAPILDHATVAVSTTTAIRSMLA